MSSHDNDTDEYATADEEASRSADSFVSFGSRNSPAAQDVVVASPAKEGTEKKEPFAGGLDKTPRTANVGGRSHANGSSGQGTKAEKKKNVGEGIAVDSLTASLLGIDFLPFTDQSDTGNKALSEGTNGSNGHQVSFNSPSDAELPTMPTLSRSADGEDADDNSTLTDPDMRPTATTISKAKKGGKRRKKLKGAFRSIKKSIARKNGTGSTGDSQMGRNNNNHDGPDRSYLPSKSLEFGEPSAAASAAAASLSVQQLNAISTDLSQLGSSANNAATRASALANRIQRLCKEISDLEARLLTSRRALAGDVAELDALTKEMDGLEVQKQTVEGRVAEMEGMARGRAEQQRRGGGGAVTASAPPPLDPPSAADLNLSPPRPRAQAAPMYPPSQQEQQERPPIVQKLSSFIRIHDLDLAQDVPSQDEASESSSKRARAASFALSVQMSEVKSGSTRSDLADVGSTIAPAIVEALARMAYDAATDDSSDRWTPSPDTKKMLSKRTDLATVSSNGSEHWIRVPSSDVYVWHSKFDHGGFGADLPVVKARGNVSTSAKSLVSLLLDSTRTKEYNKMSIGRVDEHFFHRNSLTGVSDGEEQEGGNEETGFSGGGDDDLNNGAEEEKQDAWNHLPGETRILRSLSKPPMVRKPIEILTLYHARELSDVVAGQFDGYLVVSRSIWESEDVVPSEKDGGAGSASKSTSRTEMLLGAQLIRSLEDDKCELTTINHISSKSIPMMLAKKIGLMTAASFIRDIQTVFE